MDDGTQGRMVELKESESWALLREGVVGRLAVMVGDSPDIFPVNFLVDRGTVVFRTAPGTKLDWSAGHRVAFEVDGYDPATGEAWSVVVKGHAHEVKQLYDVLDAISLPLVPWHAGAKPRFVRIDADSVTGRRFHVAADATPDTP